MQDPEFAAAFQEASAEVALQHALDQVRERRHLTKGQLAERMGVHREAVSRILTAEQSNPTLSSITSLLRGLEVTADIRLRPMEEGDAPITVAISSDIAGLPSSGAGATAITQSAYE
jgi:transcriptional regulator with XRE-family HTH domain